MVPGSVALQGSGASESAPPQALRVVWNCHTTHMVRQMRQGCGACLRVLRLRQGTSAGGLRSPRRVRVNSHRLRRGCPGGVSVSASVSASVRASVCASV